MKKNGNKLHFFSQKFVYVKSFLYFCIVIQNKKGKSIMTTQEFVCATLGCTQAECEFIDNLLDNRFPSFGDWEDNVILDFNPKYGRLCNYLINALYDEVITHYVELGLDEDKFDTDINSVCSGLIYDGEYVDEEDLEKIVESLSENEEE